MTSSEKSADPPLVADAGLRAEPRISADPLAAFNDLMLVVEALCPKWPEREPFVSAGRMLL